MGDFRLDQRTKRALRPYVQFALVCISIAIATAVIFGLPSWV